MRENIRSFFTAVLAAGAFACGPGGDEAIDNTEDGLCPIPIASTAVGPSSVEPLVEPCEPVCGDGICSSGESSGTCPQDCPPPPPPPPPPPVTWSAWLNRDVPSGAGDWETRVDFSVSQVGCALPSYVEAQTTAGVDWRNTGEVLTVSPDVGLICRNADQSDATCNNYRVRFGCATINWAYLTQAWHENVDLRDGAIIHMVPTSQSVPRARFNERMTFYTNNGFDIWRLAPNDAHYWRSGTWSRSGNVITVLFNDGVLIQERYEVAELRSSIFRFRRL
jgi:hypothetical protein